MRLPPKSHLDCRRDLNFVADLICPTKLGLIFLSCDRGTAVTSCFPIPSNDTLNLFIPNQEKNLDVHVKRSKLLALDTPTHRLCLHPQVGPFEARRFYVEIESRCY